MIVYQKAGLCIGELYHEDNTEPTGVDIARYRARTSPLAGPRVAVNHTLVVDLGHSPDQILAEMNKTTRNLIRRAANDPVSYLFHRSPDQAIASEFAGFFDAFARAKGIPLCNRERMEGLREHDSFCLSVSSQDEQPMIWHAYVCSGPWARLLYSASRLRAAATSEYLQVSSRANRRQHFLDMQNLQAAGFSTYDFGGWYSGVSDQEQLKVNQFKEGFGGQLTTVYDADQSMTTKGFLALKLRRWKDRAWAAARGAA